jgi:hypothetical protein
MAGQLLRVAFIAILEVVLWCRLFRLAGQLLRVAFIAILEVVLWCRLFRYNKIKKIGQHGMVSRLRG